MYECFGITCSRRRAVTAAPARRAVLTLLACLPAIGDAQTRDPSPVPVHDEPHHRQVFQYGATRILDLQIPPEDGSWFHSHEWPVLYMTLGTSAVRIQTPGADWRGGPPRPDMPARPEVIRATSTTSYIDEPITHRIENVGEHLFRAMVVINETHGESSTLPQAAGFTQTPELSNEWFRSYRVTLAPGEATDTHRHRAPVVIFQAEDGRGRASGPMDFEFNEPGQWAFFDSGAEHALRNEGDAALELLEIELRQP